MFLSVSLDDISDCLFFFKQKTAYEMRISDWSSDVCSSDLCGGSGMTVSAAPLSHRARAVDIQPRKLLQDFAYSLVSVTCWLAINCLAAAGLILGLFVLMANASVDQFFVEDRKSTRLNSSH